MGVKKTIDTKLEQQYKLHITHLKRLNEKYNEEMVERGKELMKIADIIRGAAHMIPQEIYEGLISIIDNYEARNTKKSDRH